jgi:hypothetical protein
MRLSAVITDAAEVKKILRNLAKLEHPPPGGIGLSLGSRWISRVGAHDA